MIEQVQALARNEGMVLHPIEDVVEGRQVELLEVKRDIRPFGFKHQEGEPVRETHVTVVEEPNDCLFVCRPVEVLDDLIELLDFAAGFEDCALFSFCAHFS